jgi:hypothetical protein
MPSKLPVGSQPCKIHPAAPKCLDMAAARDDGGVLIADTAHLEMASAPSTKTMPCASTAIRA